MFVCMNVRTHMWLCSTIHVKLAGHMLPCVPLCDNMTTHAAQVPYM